MPGPASDGKIPRIGGHAHDSGAGERSHAGVTQGRTAARGDGTHAGALQRLQQEVGNRAVSGLLTGPGPSARPARAASRRRPRGRGPLVERDAAVDALAGDGTTFNPESIVHDLRRAIDQSEATLAGVEAADGPLGGVRYKFHRKVDFDTCSRVLSGRSAAEIQVIRDLYRQQEKSDLDGDLFGKGQSGYPSSLTTIQEARLKNLLRGATGSTAGPEISSWVRMFQPTVAARVEKAIAVAGLAPDALNRIDRDALELAELTKDDLNEARRERVMALHRRLVPEFAVLDALYLGHTGDDLPLKLFGQLKGLQAARLANLREGNAAAADAFAIEDRRRAIEKIDSERASFDERTKYTPDLGGAREAGQQDLAKKRQAEIAKIDAILALNKQEALDTRDPHTAPSVAVAERLKAVLGQGSDEQGRHVGDLLFTTVGATKSTEWAAMVKGSVVEATAARLADAEARHATRASDLLQILRELRAQAEADVASDPWHVAATPGAAGQAPDEAVERLARTYIAQFQEAYDRMRGTGRPYDAIVDSCSHATDEDEVRRLTAGGGTLTPAEEIDLAIRRNKPEQAIDVLRRQRTREDVDALTVDYAKLTGGRSLTAALYGSRPYGGGAASAEQAATGPVGGPVGILGGIAHGRQAALVAEQLTKPTKDQKGKGGVAEMEWVLQSAEAEFEATWENRGVTGRLREIGDDPETETLMRESIHEIRGLAWQWRFEPNPQKRRELLFEMKRWRATLTGDAKAYEEDNKRMLDTIRSAVSIAAQLALALAMPGAGATLLGFIRVTAMNVAASVASNLLIYGEDYSLTQFRNDLVGGVLGAAGGKLGEELMGAAIAAREAGVAARETRALADELANAMEKPVAEAASRSAAKAGIGTTIAKEVANQAGSMGGQSIGTGENQFTLQNLVQNGLMLLGTKAGRHALGRDAPTTGATAGERTGGAAGEHPGGAVPEPGPAAAGGEPGPAAAGGEAGHGFAPEMNTLPGVGAHTLLPSATPDAIGQIRGITTDVINIAQMWPSLTTPEARLAHLKHAVGLRLQEHGYPEVGIIGKAGAEAGGLFSPRQREIAIAEGLLNRPQLDRQGIIEMSELLRHEVEHVMQWTDMALLEAGRGRTVDEIVAATQQYGAPELARSIAEWAVDAHRNGRGIDPASPRARAAELHQGSVYGNRTNRFGHTRAQVLAELHLATEALHAVERAIATELPTSPIHAMALAQRNAAWARYGQAQAEYRSLSEEQGAFLAGDLAKAEADIRTRDTGPSGDAFEDEPTRVIGLPERRTQEMTAAHPAGAPPDLPTDAGDAGDTIPDLPAFPVEGEAEERPGRR